MSGRWSTRTQTEQSSSAVKYYLEAQTEESFYHEGFSQMDFFLSPPIENVKHCIKLLKVASQIEYKELTVTCLQCFPAIPWTPDEEEQIRRFCVSGQYVNLCCNSATDLRARITSFPTGQKQEELGACVHRTIQRYLKASLRSIDNDLVHCRAVFGRACHTIVTGSVTEDKCHRTLIRYVLNLAKERLERHLCVIK